MTIYTNENSVYSDNGGYGRLGFIKSLMQLLPHIMRVVQGPVQQPPRQVGNAMTIVPAFGSIGGYEALTHNNAQLGSDYYQHN